MTNRYIGDKTSLEDLDLSGNAPIDCKGTVQSLYFNSDEILVWYDNIIWWLEMGDACALIRSKCRRACSLFFGFNDGILFDIQSFIQRRLETNTYAVNALIVQPKWNKFHSTVLCSTELSSVVEAATGNANKSNKERYGLGSTAAQCDNFAKIKWLDLLTRSSFGAWSFNTQDNIWCIRDVERERVNEQRFYTHSRLDRKEKTLYVDYAKNWDVVLNLQSLVE